MFRSLCNRRNIPLILFSVPIHNIIAELIFDFEYSCIQNQEDSFREYYSYIYHKTIANLTDSTSKFVIITY